MAVVVALVGSILPVAMAGSDDDTATVDYLRQVRPILARRCFACHGSDPQTRKASLRLDRRDEAVAEAASGVAAIVPGSPDESELMARIEAEADDPGRMPPESSGPGLEAAEIDILRRWIEQGSPYAEHWAFVPPVEKPLPAVQSPKWVRDPVIDPWVLSRLEAASLTPQPEADPDTLLRRASLDLRGLPPTPEERRAFHADSAPGAYERAVDRFLDDPAYGERMARMWLDLARFADSAGYGSDPLRPAMWPYRDWLIDAFNQNLPYDRFTVEQIAGDLLPDATNRQRTATAFHRNTMTNTEGGTDDEEFRVAAVKDRVNTTVQVWMGLTMGCAQCHTHKYDPIAQDEYYGMFAVFNQTADNDQPDESPTLEVRTGVKLPVMVEVAAENRRASHVLEKGSFLTPGKAVEPGLIGAFVPEGVVKSGRTVDRLAVARWLVDERNPLTARVMVNRLWALAFGTGIVATEEDFGSQGELPSHPELLDALAVRFVQSGWDVKALMRSIVTSAAYRQSSRTTARALEVDPNNRLLSHAPRYRLEAEAVRDQALAVAGLLDRRIGGPSVFPAQPDGLWQAAFNGERTWKTSEGTNRYRRGLYTFWRRTVPYPSMAAFDAPSRELCTVRRIRTNTPIQAFVTLNDPVYVEAAQALGRRIVREGGSTTEERLRFALELATGREAESRQVDVLRALHDDALARLKAGDPAEAMALATEPVGPLPEGADAVELAAWTTVANVILNLDAVLTRN
jgi:mono/diheme cytochrome c family protein